MGTKTRKVSVVQESADCFVTSGVSKKEDASVVAGEYPLVHKVDGIWTGRNDPTVRPVSRHKVGGNIPRIVRRGRISSG